MITEKCREMIRDVALGSHRYCCASPDPCSDNRNSSSYRGDCRDSSDAQGDRHDSPDVRNTSNSGGACRDSNRQSSQYSTWRCAHRYMEWHSCTYFHGLDWILPPGGGESIQ
jgi:hypothetical protein